MSRRPAPDLSATALVTTWLPAEFARGTATLPDDVPAVRLTLSGTGGGDFLLRPGERGMGLAVQSVTPSQARALARDPELGLWVRMAAADLLAALHGDDDLPPLLPAEREVRDLLLLDAESLAAVQRLQGRIALEISGRRRRRFVLDVAFGAQGMSAGRPRSTVSLSATTAQALSRGERAPLQALVDGSVTITGDRGLAMQMLMLFAARWR